MDVVVLADTHLRKGIDALPRSVLDAIDRCDLVLHAGDVTSPTALEELARLRSVHAVLGNNDRELVGRLPTDLVLDLDGVRVAMVHDTGPTAGRHRRMDRRYPAAELIVFGHSHVPIDEVGIDGQRLFNPGSPTQRRTQAHRSFGRLRFEEGAVIRHSIELLDD